MQNIEKKDWVPTNPDFNSDKPMQVGGQAVIEGVMMRAPGTVATAVRRSNGQIVVSHQKFTSITEKYKLLNIPLLRGAVGLIDIMYLGIKTLNFSAEIAMRDIENAKPKDNGSGSKPDGTKKTTGKSNLALAGTLIFALLVGILIFFVVPLYLTTSIFSIEQTAVLFNLTAGIIRTVMLIAYMALISIMKDVRRLFSYHGAEHKSVFAFELNSPLEPDAVKGYSRFHPRCGTSFLLLVLFTAIISFSLLDLLVIYLFGTISLPVRLITHIPFIPVVGGAAYEIIKFSAKRSNTWWGRTIAAPGLWLQRITTREPGMDEIEVALVALRCALGLENPEKYTMKTEQALSQAVTAE